MGEEETTTEGRNAAANGNTALEKAVEVLTENQKGENNAVKAAEEEKIDNGEGDAHKMEVDKNDNGEGDTNRMDEDPKVNDEKLEEAVKEELAEEHTKEEAKEKELVKRDKQEKEQVEKEEKEEEEKEVEKKEEDESKTEPVEEQSSPQEDTNIGEKKDIEEDSEEKVDESKEKEEKIEDNKEKGLRKHGKGKSGAEKKSSGATTEKKAVEMKKVPEPRTPTVSRPQRERKSVERLVATIERDNSTELHIEKGSGTPLKDIPNVAFKLSRRKLDDTFKLLHMILFGRRGKAVQIKSNILRFSGFVWRENEEKQKNKVKEKFDKCNKEKLLEFCDVLDISIPKTTTKKDDVVTKLMEFLLAPHATTTVLLSEIEKESKSKKRKRVTKPSATGNAHLGHSVKSRKKAQGASNTKKGRTDTDDESEEEKDEEEENVEEENDSGFPEKSDAEMSEYSEDEKNESEEDSEEDARKWKRRSKTSSRKKASAGKATPKKTAISSKSRSPVKRATKKSSSKTSESDEDSDASPKVSRKKITEKLAEKKFSTRKRTPSKERTGKKATKANEKAKVEEETLKPSADELKDAICEILKNVDFNTATFTDIMKQLARKFDTNLTPRKSLVKSMIQDELTRLAEVAEDEEGEGDAEKKENQSAAQEVEA